MICYLATDDIASHDPEAERKRRVELYAKNYDKHLSELGINPAKQGQNVGPVWRPVYCPDVEPQKALTRDGRAPAACFFSPVHAARFFDTNRHNILRAMRLGTMCCGTHFFPIPDAPVIRARTGRERAVLCVELDVEFETLLEAAQFAHVPQATMHKGIKLSRPVGAAGWTFRYADDDEMPSGMAGVPAPLEPPPSSLSATAESKEQQDETLDVPPADEAAAFSNIHRNNNWLDDETLAPPEHELAAIEAEIALAAA